MVFVSTSDTWHLLETKVSQNWAHWRLCGNSKSSIPWEVPVSDRISQAQLWRSDDLVIFTDILRRSSAPDQVKQQVWLPLCNSMSPWTLPKLNCFHSYLYMPRITSSQSGVTILSTAWPPITKLELCNQWTSWGHCYYTSLQRVCFCNPSQELGRPDSRWQGKASAVCVGPLLKPLAESFQNTRTGLRFCCWSAQTGGNRIAPPAQSVRLSWD